jgi:iron complex outermembrane receptor protein
MGWAPLESVNFYVKWSEGYNSGGHYYDSCNNDYNSETLDTIEGGIKGRWFDGRLTADLAGYWNDYKNYQIFIELPALISTAVDIINAPEAETYGGEFQVTALPTENFTVNLGLSIMHSQYDALSAIDPINVKAGVQNLSGKQMQRSPNHTEQVGLEYSWPVPWGRILGDSTRRFLNLGPLKVRGEWYHTDTLVFHPFGKTGPAPFGALDDVQHPYSIFNFYATLPTEDGKWSLRFFAKNFTNTKYYSFKYPDGWNYFGVGGAPPWFGGDLTYRF